MTSVLETATTRHGATLDGGRGKCHGVRSREGGQKLVAYFRVSTRRQGASGLGLEGQQAEVERYANSSTATVLASYTEIESGRKAERPQLRLALAHARRAKAVLVVAKLDRLSPLRSLKLAPA